MVVRIAIIGQGAIASYVRTQLLADHDDSITEVAQVVRPGQEDRTATPPRLASVAALLELTRTSTNTPGVDWLVDCAGHGALVEHGPAALRGGIHVLTVSLGALADDAFYQRLRTAATEGQARLTLVPGAIGGLDALRSAAASGGLQTVTYTGRKPPAGWQGSPAANVLGPLDQVCVATVHFTGTARQAALDYPKNANVAAAVALAGIGWDRTRVQLIADPSVTRNVHEIHASGAFGEMHLSIAGRSLPDNPRSSALAAMSVVAALVEGTRPIGF
jgi:aspartate dehydrogenase